MLTPCFAVAVERQLVRIFQQARVPVLRSVFGQEENVLYVVVVVHEMQLVVEDELALQSLRPLGGGRGLGGFGGRHREDGPEHIVERDKRGRHAAARAQKLPPAGAESFRGRTGQLFQPGLELPLSVGLRQRVEFTVRHHSGRYRRAELDAFGRRGPGQLAFAQKDSHASPPHDCARGSSPPGQAVVVG
ncbi:MAG: hypothetical protein ACREFQ_22190 [Stellaceae bacterium]